MTSASDHPKEPTHTPPTHTTPPATPHTPDPECIRPQRPMDTSTFEQLAHTYTFEQTSNAQIMFTRLIRRECLDRTSPVRVLDIGCGRGIARNFDLVRALRPHIDDLWGIEPDPDVAPQDGLFDHVQTALLEDADLPDNHFDIAYAFMVMEHVADPAAFMHAVSRCLKPGGVFIFATPNAKHYFTRTAKLCNTLRIDELVLRIAKGRDQVDEYHYPVVYKFNDEHSIARHAQDAGMRKPLIAYMEHKGPYGYMRGPLRPIFHILCLKRRIFKNPKSLLALFGRIEKPSTTA